MTIAILIILILILLLLVFISTMVYKSVNKIKKMHYLISANSMDLGKIEKNLMSEDSYLSKMEKKVDAIHTMICTPIVKALMNKKDK